MLTTIHLLEMAKLIIEAGNVYYKLIIRYEKLGFDDIGFHIPTYP